MTVFSLDERLVREALEKWVAQLTTRSEVVAVVLFGSFPTGRALPGSDLDVVILLDEDTRPFRNRIPDYLPDSLPLPVDVFPYTLAELAAGEPLAEEALRTGVVLWVRPGVDLPCGANDEPALEME